MSSEDKPRGLDKLLHPGGTRKPREGSPSPEAHGVGKLLHLGRNRETSPHVEPGEGIHHEDEPQNRRYLGLEHLSGHHPGRHVDIPHDYHDPAIRRSSPSPSPGPYDRKQHWKEVKWPEGGEYAECQEHSWLTVKVLQKHVKNLPGYVDGPATARQKIWVEVSKLSVEKMPEDLRSEIENGKKHPNSKPSKVHVLVRYLGKEINEGKNELEAIYFLPGHSEAKYARDFVF